MTQVNRNWCFTIFNYDEDLITHLKNMNGVKHCIFQEEECPTTNKKHLQGHVIWKSAKTLSATKKCLGSDTCHLEIMRGTPKQSSTYCSKDETHNGIREEIGECPVGQGTRSDLEECIMKIRSLQLKYNDIEVEYPQLFVQYRNGLREICDKYHGTKRDFKSNVSVMYGKSGTGKSKDAFASSTDTYVLRCNKTQVWFDGYDYNDTLIIDDFYGWIPFNMLLNLLDRYAMKVDVKGGAMEFNSKNIIITSNKSPLDWYPNLSKEHQYALLRRLDCVKYYKRDGIYDVTKGIAQKLHELRDDDDMEDDELFNITQKLDNSTEVPQGNTTLEVRQEMPNFVLPIEDTKSDNDTCSVSGADSYNTYDITKGKLVFHEAMSSGYAFLERETQNGRLKDVVNLRNDSITIRQLKDAVWDDIEQGFVSKDGDIFKTI